MRAPPRVSAPGPPAVRLVAVFAAEKVPGEIRPGMACPPAEPGAAGAAVTDG
jgi:hypothetical protein